MWIETQEGKLVNLDFIQDIEIKTERKRSKLIAVRTVNQSRGHFTLREFDTQEEARDYLKAIGQTLRRKERLIGMA